MNRQTNYEQNYFDNIYSGHYYAHNPLYKIVYYLKAIRTLKPHGRLLDIGCAFGLFLEHARVYYECEGCDVSTYAISVARKRLPDVPFSVSDILSLSLESHYDIICCFDVLEHIPNLDAAAMKIRNLLNDGGFLVLVVPVYDTLVGQLVSLLDKDPTHIHKESRDFWLRKLTDWGFAIKEFHGIFRYSVAGRFYIHFGHPYLRRFSPAILLASQKD